MEAYSWEPWTQEPEEQPQEAVAREGTSEAASEDGAQEAGAGDREGCGTLACPAYQHQQGAKAALHGGLNHRCCACVRACVRACVSGRGYVLQATSRGMPDSISLVKFYFDI